RYAEGSAEVTAEAGGGRISVADIALERGNVISGRVVGPDGEPLAEARVWANTMSARQQGVRMGSQTQRGRNWARARTDADGHFELVGLVAGPFKVTASAPGMVNRTVDADPQGTPVELRLVAAVPLEGRVTHAGQPVAGVNVSARRGGDWLDSARTDGDGRFRLDQLPPDQAFTLTLRHDAYKTLSLENVRAGGAPREYELREGGVVAGTVVDEAGTPVPGVGVRLGAAEAASPDGAVGMVGRPRSAQTDEEGRFRIRGLAGERYRVHVASSDWVAAETPEVSVGDLDVRIVVHKGLSIAGTVLDAGGRPVPQAVVQAESASTGKTGYAVSGEDGTFEIGGLVEGTYRLYVHQEGRRHDGPGGVGAGATGVTVQLPE
ncbi:MAG: carboxypeptidase-like regulatory domain-containing protein, partial [Planctomycetota bacterium]